MQTTIAYVAGKSGGHITPALQQAAQAHHHDPSKLIIFFSTSARLDTALIAASSCITKHIALPVTNLPAKKYHYPFWIGQFIVSFFVSMYQLLKYNPEQLVSTGGLVSVPTCLAAWLLGVPIELQELNATPGKAIKFLARFATTITVCFPEAQRYFASCFLKEYPMRFKNSANLSSIQARQLLGLDLEKKTVLIVGGSQGSQFLNLLIQDYCRQSSLHREIQIIHQTGTAHVKSLEKFYAQENIQAIVFAYRQDLEYCYQAANTVIARAGAGTLFELLHFKKRSFIIPLELQSTDHQYDNGRSFAAQYPNLFTMYRQADITENPLEFYQHLTQAIVYSVATGNKPTISCEPINEARS
jgi:UDP-N-acetylglucosamine--N-acetylmuramyl-(pentapeptide) pyrophosphoryl-undecaprenol N-acetylglucosamine transferase